MLHIHIKFNKLFLTKFCSLYFFCFIIYFMY